MSTQTLAKKPWSGGFTLVEILVVMAIIAALGALALPRYFKGLERSKDAILVENLRVVRDAIDQYRKDAGQYPESLSDLVRKQYLKSMPYDPIVRSHSHWRIIAPPMNEKGQVYDLRSSAQGQAYDGRLYRNL